MIKDLLRILRELERSYETVELGGETKLVSFRISELPHIRRISLGLQNGTYIATFKLATNFDSINQTNKEKLQRLSKNMPVKIGSEGFIEITVSQKVESGQEFVKLLISSLQISNSFAERLISEEVF